MSPRALVSTVALVILASGCQRTSGSAPPVAHQSQRPLAIPASSPSRDADAIAMPVVPAPLLVDSGTAPAGTIQETRPVVDFTRVANQTSLDVHVVIGTAVRVVVTAEPTVMPLISTVVSNGVLTIGSTRSFVTTLPGSVDVTLTQFAGAENSASANFTVVAPQTQGIALANRGSGNLRFSGQAGAVTIDLSGSGSTTLTGSGASLTGTSGGSGTLDATGFPVNGAALTMVGSGNANLTVHGNARLNLTGSGRIQAALDGGTADFALIGSGSIEWSGSSVVGTSSTVGSGSIVHRP